MTPSQLSTPGKQSSKANDWSLKSRIAILGGILLVGFAVRVFAAYYWQSSVAGESHFRFGDSDSYWLMASKIKQGLPYQYGSPDSRVFRAPLYPIFLSVFTASEQEQRNWEMVFAARIAGCAMGAVCIYLLMLIASRLGRSDDLTTGDQLLFGVWAGILAMLYPGAIGMSIFVLSEAIFCPLMLLSLGFSSLAIEAKQKERWEVAWSWMLLSGAVSGAACLARPSWSLWPAVLFAYLLCLMWQSMKKRIAGKSALQQSWQWGAGCGLFCLGVCMVMSPWWVRNYMETDKFVPTTLQVGASLYDGWHPGASGSSDEGMEFVNAFIVEQKAEDERTLLTEKKLESTLEWRVDQRLKNAAIDWALGNSSDAMKLGLVKLVKTWSPLPVARELGSDAVRWMEAIGYTAIMVFAAIGMWRSRFDIGAWLFAMPCLYFALLHMFFIGSVRYRQPAVLAICVLGGVGCTTVSKWIYAKVATRNAS